MSQLLCYFRLVRLFIAFVAPSAVVGGMMVFHRDLAVCRSLEKETCTGSGGTQLRHLAESVVIAIVGRACAMRSKEICAYLTVVTHHGCVEICVVIIACMLVEISGVRNVHKITYRFFRNDIHDSGYRIRAINGRSSASHPLYAVHHCRRHLLHSIDRSHGGKHRPAIHQYLGVLPLQAVDTQIRFAAVGTSVLYPQAGLKTERIGYAGNRRCFK